MAMNLPLNIDWHQILLHLFNFAILFAVLYFLLYGPVKKFMQSREEHYRDMDEKANKSLSDAETYKQEYARKLKGVEDEIERERMLSRQKLSSELEKARIAAEKEADDIVKKANEKAKQERTRILDDAQREIADMVTAAAAKIMPRSSAKESYDSFLDKAEGSGGNE